MSCRSKSLNKVIQRCSGRSELCERYSDAFYSIVYSENIAWTGSEVENEIIVRESKREERL